MRMHLSQSCNARRLSVQRISGLDKCSNLRELELAGNSITDMSGLSCLTALKKLVLTSNRISAVTGLEHLASLEHLLLQGNQLQTMQSVNLPLLAQLPALCSLYLRNVDRTQV